MGPGIGPKSAPAGAVPRRTARFDRRGRAPMRLVLQRVAHARVGVDGKRVCALGPGLLVLAGVAAGDDSETVRLAAERLLTLRLFAATSGRMILDLPHVGCREFP